MKTITEYVCKRTIQSINYLVNEKYKDVQVEKEDKKKREVEVEGRVKKIGITV